MEKIIEENLSVSFNLIWLLSTIFKFTVAVGWRFLLPLQISAFLIPVLAFEMCSTVGLTFERADFQLSPSDIVLKLNIHLADAKVLIASPPSSIRT
jgi:hypothetical protein